MSLGSAFFWWLWSWKQKWDPRKRTLFLGQKKKGTPFIIREGGHGWNRLSCGVTSNVLAAEFEWVDYCLGSTVVSSIPATFDLEPLNWWNDELSRFLTRFLSLFRDRERERGTEFGQVFYFLHNQSLDFSVADSDNQRRPVFDSMFDRVLERWGLSFFFSCR